MTTDPKPSEPRRRKLHTRFEHFRRMHAGWKVVWLTDEGITLDSETFSNRVHARKAARLMKQDEGYDARVVRVVWEPA